MLRGLNAKAPTILVSARSEADRQVLLLDLYRSAMPITVLYLDTFFTDNPKTRNIIREWEVTEIITSHLNPFPNLPSRRIP